MNQLLPENNAIQFRYGIPGFEFLTKFLIAEVEGYSPFRVLTSIEKQDFTMLILDVNFISSQIEMKIPKKELKKININGSDDSEMAVYAILKYDKASQAFTANMKAPIVVNSEALVGQQVILDDDRLSVNQPLTLLQCES
ncbi:MAG: flagellar assembly protein FliW [Calditrichaeota bacterium]|nr:flagellar assembly protein FliW [Calditrichota bacterium]